MSESKIVWGIKFGGSSITRKESLHSFNEQNLDWMISVVSKIFKQGHSVVIVHGAGSFGHYEWSQVKSLLSQNNDENLLKIKLKISETRHHVQRLNREIVNRLLKAEIPALSISPFDCGDFNECDLSRLSTLVERGYIPVVHGDLQMSSSKFPWFTVLSGDTILNQLSNLNIINRSIYVTDVYGVYTSIPTEESQLSEDTARKGLIKRVRIHKDEPETVYDLEMFEDSNKVQSEITTQTKHSHDVTGGFETKLKEAFQIAKRGHPVYIVKVATDNINQLFADTIDGRFLGTEILPVD